MRFSGTDHNWICLGVRTTLNVAHPRYTLPQSQRREWGAPSLGPLPVYERETLASNANDDDVDYFLHLCVSQQCDSTRLLAARNAHPIFPYKANADIAISGFHLPHSSIVINQCLITYKAGGGHAEFKLNHTRTSRYPAEIGSGQGLSGTSCKPLASG